MEKSKLYTGTGDKGTTSLVGGQRVAKDGLRLEAYGTVDEFSAHLGLLTGSKESSVAVCALLLGIQNKLFNIGAYLATAGVEGTKPDPRGLTDDDIKVVEQGIDAIDGGLPKLSAFILPGGTRAAVEAHIARTVCRRAERCIVRLTREEYVSPLVLTYFNRISDLLFALSRHYNYAAGVPETTWRQ